MLGPKLAPALEEIPLWARSASDICTWQKKVDAVVNEDGHFGRVDGAEMYVLRHDSLLSIIGLEGPTNDYGLPPLGRESSPDLRRRQGGLAMLTIAAITLSL
jgi:hypothetical protein